MKLQKFTTLLTVFIFTFLFAFQPVYSQLEKAVVPSGITVSGVPNLPKAIQTEMDSYSERVSSNFLGWTKDGTLFGYSQYYEPFLKKSPEDSAPAIEIDIDNPETVSLQPKSEKVLVYLQDKNGDEALQLYEYDPATKKTVQLTKAPEIERVSSYAWSETGETIYFTNRKRSEGKAEIYELRLDDGKQTRLAILDGGDAQFIEDAHADNLLFYNYLANNHTIYNLFNLKTQKTTQLTNSVSLFKKGKLSRVRDGAYWLSDENSDSPNLYYYDFKTKNAAKINKSPMNISDFMYSPDEKHYALKVNNSGADSLRVYESGIEAKELPAAPVPVGMIAGFGWRNNEELGFSFESLRTPTSIKTLSIKTNTVTDWTKANAASEVAERVQDPEIIKWKSFDNREISGFIFKPAKTAEASESKLPVLIDIHGGPRSQYQPFFNEYRGYEVARLKIAMIFPNIRGSSGFGKEFENLDNREKRGDAVKDLEALLDWIATQPDLDATKVIIRGTSYGGFMAMALGIKEQTRIKGIIAEVPPVSIKNYILAAPKSMQDIQAYEYGSTTDDASMSITNKMSLLDADNLSNWDLPLLITAGQNDVRTPVADIEKLNTSLTSKGKTVWFIKANNEGHAWGKKENNVFLELAVMSFIVRFGKNSGK